MSDEPTQISAWHERFYRQREYNKRKHSPACTEAMMKSYRCMGKNSGMREKCEHLIEAMHQCRNAGPEQEDAIQRKLTSTPEASILANTPPPVTG